MSCPIRCDTRVSALVGVSQLCRRSSCSFACSSVSPMIGITPGRIGSVVRRAAMLDHALLQAVVGGLGRGLVAVDHGEHQVGRAGRELLPGRRAAGLDDDRMALRPALDVERAFDLNRSGPCGRAAAPSTCRGRCRSPCRQRSAPSSQQSQSPRTTSTNSRCDLVAQIVLVELLLAEIERRLVVGAGHDVPGGAAAAEMIERGEGARDVVRLAEARRHRRAEADMASSPCSARTSSVIGSKRLTNDG